jgi:regulator of protease activity HflC (stomatin/prohibitin superfamily)
MEKNIRPMSGFLMLLFGFLLLIAAVFLLIGYDKSGPGVGPLASVLIICALFIFRGILVVNPNHAVVLVFFGKYVGSVKKNGLLWINPFYKRQHLSLRSQNLNGPKLKVNDKMGNPIEIAAVCVWQVSDTYRASFDVANYQQYVVIQSEAAVRHLAVSYAYDNFEDGNEITELTLRAGGDKVNEMLEKELTDRLAPAGILIKEARISHLAYAPEIAGAMLQRQQATAIVAARAKIVEGAVGMVEMALEMLSKKQIVELDEERKAAMVSNLMVVLCGDKATVPVVNAGSLY